MNYKISIIIIILILLTFRYNFKVFANEAGDELFQKAQELEKTACYTEANKIYNKAREEYLSAGEIMKARACKVAIQNIQRICIEYPYDEDKVKKLLSENFKNIPENERNSWIKSGKIDSIMSDGKPYYFVDFIKNLKYGDPTLRDGEFFLKYREFFSKLQNIIFKYPDTSYPQPSWQPYIHPMQFLVTYTFNIPREKLPKKGDLGIWFPMAVITAPQPDVKIISITPEQYVSNPPSVDAKISLVYMEIPLEGLKDDLNIKIDFMFSHYEQKFNVKPEKMVAYNTESYIYQEFTRSGDNIAITPEIKQKALEIVGDEKNPYLAAKKLYYYVVENISYSYVPHARLNALKMPESVYAHQKGYGDCGTQSMYFSALCRSIGIPARTTGGYQMCLGTEGSHFWAEFYLPYYGWIPVDTSIAQIADYIPEITEEQKDKFKEYYFGSMDPYRWVIQKDVDEPLTPEPGDPILLPMAIQSPAINCTDSVNLPAITLLEYWKVDVMPIYP